MSIDSDMTLLVIFPYSELSLSIAFYLLCRKSFLLLLVVKVLQVFLFLVSIVS